MIALVRALVVAGISLGWPAADPAASTVVADPPSATAPEQGVAPPAGPDAHSTDSGQAPPPAPNSGAPILDDWPPGYSESPGGTPPRGVAGSIQRFAALGAASLAVVSLTVAVVEHATWQSRVDSFANMSCGTALPALGGPRCQPIYDQGQRARILAFVGYGLAAGFAATAAILYLVPPAAAAGARKLACAVNPITPSIGCGWRF